MICYNCMREKGTSPVCPYCRKGDIPPAEPHQLRQGTVIAGRYTVGRVLGEGGFGITYIGRNNFLETTVAIKEYFPYGYAQRNNEASGKVSIVTTKENDFFIKGRDRFLQEAKNVARFRRQPGIVEVTDFIEENNTAYIIMEYLDGITLKDYLRKNGVMKPKNAVGLLMPVMQALEKIHRAGIIHRDISPDNIMYLKDGTVKLMDFGAARTYDTEQRSMSVMLKPGYAPEEQYRRGGEQGPWTDVYGICATLYRCISGKAPLDAVDRLAEDTLKKPSELGAAISPRLESVLMYGLALRKKDRCKDMTELVRLFVTAMDEDAKQPIAPAGGYTQNRPSYDSNRQQQGYHAQTANTQTGNRTAQNTSPSYPARQTTQSPARQTQTQQPVESYAQPHPVTVQPPAVKKKSGKKKIAIIVTAIVLVMIGAAVAAVILFNRPKEVDPKRMKKAENEYYSNGNIKVEKEVGDNYGVLKETSYTISGKKSGTKEYELDSKGNQIVEKWYNAAGKLRYTFKNEFDSDGNVSKSTQYDYSGDLYGWYEYKYDSDGNEIMEKWCCPSGASYSHYEREYDSDGNKILEKKFNGYGNLVWTDKIEYDSDGRMTKLTEYNDKEEITDEYTYDEEERIQKRFAYNSSGGVESFYEYEYDSDGNNTKRLEYDADDNLVYRYEYKFDDEGNNTEYRGYDDSDDLKWKYEYQYDDRGFMTQGTSYGSNGSLMYKVEYDKHELPAVFTWYDSSEETKYYREYERDEDRKATKSTKYDKDGKVTEYDVYEYNKNGDYTTISTYDSSDNLKSYKEYEYDDAGNETKVTEYDSEGKVVSEESD